MRNGALLVNIADTVRRRLPTFAPACAATVLEAFARFRTYKQPFLGEVSAALLSNEQLAPAPTVIAREHMRTGHFLWGCRRIFFLHIDNLTIGHRGRVSECLKDQTVFINAREIEIVRCLRGSH